jgi:hypothetical protein
LRHHGRRVVAEGGHPEAVRRRLRRGGQPRCTLTLTLTRTLTLTPTLALALALALALTLAAACAVGPSC